MVNSGEKLIGSQGVFLALSEIFHFPVEKSLLEDAKSLKLMALKIIHLRRRREEVEGQSTRSK